MVKREWWKTMVNRSAHYYVLVWLFKDASKRSHESKCPERSEHGGLIGVSEAEANGCLHVTNPSSSSLRLQETYGSTRPLESIIM